MGDEWRVVRAPRRGRRLDCANRNNLVPSAYIAEIFFGYISSTNRPEDSSVAPRDRNDARKLNHCGNVPLTTIPNVLMVQGFRGRFNRIASSRG